MAIVGPHASLLGEVDRRRERDVRGIAVLDDLTPEDQWPPEWRDEPDPVREFWLNDPRLAATEITVSHDMAIILATRIQ